MNEGGGRCLPEGTQGTPVIVLVFFCLSTFLLNASTNINKTKGIQGLGPDINNLRFQGSMKKHFNRVGLQSHETNDPIPARSLRDNVVLTRISGTRAVPM